MRTDYADLQGHRGGVPYRQGVGSTKIRIKQLHFDGQISYNITSFQLWMLNTL